MRFRHRQSTFAFYIVPRIPGLRASLSRAANVWCFLADPRSPWYLPCRLPRCQASLAAGWYRGRLHLLFRLHQDPREHPEGHLRRYLQHLRLPDPQPVEGDQAHPLPSRGVRRYPAHREALLDWSHEKLWCLEGRLRAAILHGFGKLVTSSSRVLQDWDNWSYQKILKSVI